MDVRSGHLVRDINTVPEAERANYTPVPPALFDEAQRELGDKPEVYVSPARQSALNAWAAKKRKKQRARAKLAKASRRRNSKV